MKLDWSKLNIFFSCTFLETGATIEPNHRFAKMQQLWQKNKSNFLTLTANLQHSELDCPVFQFQSTCISWLTKVKVTSLQSKEQTSMLLSGQKPPCKPTGWCYSKGCCAQFSSYLSNAASEIYKCFSSDIEFAFVSSNHEICKRKKNSKWQHTNELGYKRDVGLAVGLGTGNPSC